VTFGYPVVLDLAGVPALVVGAGPIAARKVAGLVAAGARVRVVAPTVTPELDRAGVAELHRRPYERGDLDGVQLVITATGRADVDARVAADARAAGVWVNAADQPADCSFILPAIARRGPLSIAVSTAGASPALARRLRDHAGRLLTDAVVALAAELSERRREVRAAGGSTEDVDWSALIDPVLAPIEPVPSEDADDVDSDRWAPPGRG
jgi:siroheme synthase-like protein